MGKFLYFGYGSNLLAKRIHVKNPSATRRGIAKLKDYRLDFNTPHGYIPLNWGGAPATIVPEVGSHVWGAMWELDDSDLENLDDQESVKDGMYQRITINVEALDGTEHSCLSYCLVNQPKKLKCEEARTSDRLPSQIYMDVILKGADESGIPEEYIFFLRSIPTNGFTGGPSCPVKLPYL